MQGLSWSCQTFLPERVLLNAVYMSKVTFFGLGQKVGKESFCVLRLHCILSHVSNGSLPFVRKLSLPPCFRFIPSFFGTSLPSKLSSSFSPTTYTDISCPLHQIMYILSKNTTSIRISHYTQYRLLNECQNSLQ